MCCFVLLFSALGPRFAILAIWVFSSRVNAAFGTALWPLLGLLVAPWTTLMYLLAWSPGGPADDDQAEFEALRTSAARDSSGGSP
jgi:hypothetical protein